MSYAPETRQANGEESFAQIAWVYELRKDAFGDAASDLRDEDSRFRTKLDRLAPGGFVYFVVHDDSFDVFRAARELAQSRGIQTGWHPLERDEPVVLSVAGSLGKRVQ